MRLMRRTIQKAGVKIFDRSPALELLADYSGVGGAIGVNLDTGEDWIVKAKSVVIATGGCAFLSNALGCNVLTGDGYLMAVEAGADLSGMEFSNAYGFSTDFSSCTKNLLYHWATFYNEDGSIIEKRDKRSLSKILQVNPIYAKLDKATEDIKVAMRYAQPNFF
ncbi:hypothetical protein JCM16163A_35180 [Paenibacillus sp. YK5]